MSTNQGRGRVGVDLGEAIKVGLTVDMGNKNKEKTSYERMIKEGFTKMSRPNITTFKPSVNHTKKNYITIIYYDAEGDVKVLAENVPHASNHSVIVSATGSITDSKKPTTPWIDKNDKNHQQEPCESCEAIYGICTVCLIGSRIEKIQHSIGVVSSCQVTHSLVQTIEKMSSEKKSARKERKQMT